MKSQEITKRWVDFFVSKGHTAVPSASLVSSDPSLLFTVAGMVPFIPYLTGREPAPFPRHEVDDLGRDLLGRAHEIAFVFPIFVIDDDDHAAVADVFDLGLSRGEIDTRLSASQ